MLTFSLRMTSISFNLQVKRARDTKSDPYRMKNVEVVLPHCTKWNIFWIKWRRWVMDLAIVWAWGSPKINYLNYQRPSCTLPHSPHLVRSQKICYWEGIADHFSSWKQKKFSVYDFLPGGNTEAQKAQARRKGRKKCDCLISVLSKSQKRNIKRKNHSNFPK